MDSGAWLVVATVAVFGLGNLGVLVWLLSELKTKVLDHDRRIENGERERAATSVSLGTLTTDVARLKQEAGIA